MDADAYQKLKSIYQSAVEVTGEDRLRLLDEQCAGEPDLRAEVEKLLASSESEFLEVPANGNLVASLGEDFHSTFTPGQRIGHYSVVKKIGSGGMGEVYLALDGKLGRRVAIKILPDEFTADEDRLHRFQLEARAASALSHPNILTIHEIGEWDGTHYIATEYVEGETLRQHIGRGRLPLAESLDVGVQLVSAIAAAHEAGICHRDIKPENIMIRGDGIIKVVDFGLAKLNPRAVASEFTPALQDEPTVRMVKTEPGVIMGTVQYMSPEQTRGMPTDERSDIWSLGCVLYEMAAGRPPFRGESSADLIAEIVKTHPEPLSSFDPDIPERLNEIVDKALEKQPDDRYQTAKDLLIDLKRLKRRCDADAELERSQPRINTDADEAVISAPNIISTKKGPKDLTTVNSAEYLYWGMKAHRWTAIGITVFVFALLGTTAYIVRQYWRGPNETRMHYASKVRLAAQALQGSNLAAVERLLKETTPTIGEEDMRGFEWGYLSRLYSERMASQPLDLPHDRPVESVAFSPDEKILATGSDNSIHLWDVATGTKLKTLNGHTGSVRSIDFSRDGNRLLSGSADKTARLWDIDTEAATLVLGSDAQPVSDPQFSPDGRSIGCVTGNEVKFWSVETGKETSKSLKTDNNDALFALSPDGRLAAFRAKDHSVVVVDMSTDRSVATLKGHSGSIAEIEFSPDSKLVLTGSDDGTAKLWEVNKAKSVKTFSGHSGEVLDVAFGPDGKIIATGSADDSIKIWDVEKGTLRNTLKGHLAGVQALAFSKDGRSLASGGGLDDKSAKVWNVPVNASRGVLRGHSKEVKSVAFSGDGKLLVSSGSDNTTRIWSVQDENEVRVLTDADHPVFSPDGRTLASGGKGNKLKFWDIVNGRVRQTINLPHPTTDLVYSPDGKFLVTGHWFHDRMVRIWESETGKEVCSFPAHKAGPWFMSFSADGRRIVTSALDDSSIRVWETSSCREASAFVGEPDSGYISSVAPNGKILALQGINNLRSLRLIEIEDGTEIASFSGHEAELSGAEFSPDGTRLATSARDGTIRVWDAVTGQELLLIKTDVGKIESIAFSPDGKILAAAGGDGTIRLFRSSSLSDRQSLVSRFEHKIEHFSSIVPAEFPRP